MKRDVVKSDQLFEIEDIFGKWIRTSRNYWRRIKLEKHSDLEYGVEYVKQTLQEPDAVYRSVTDSTICLYRRRMNGVTLVAVAKHLNGDGFLVTAYQTTKEHKKGERLWPK